MASYRLPCADPLCRRWLLDALPRDFPARLASLLQYGDGTGALGLPDGAGLVRGDLRRQVGGAYFVQLRFALGGYPWGDGFAELLGPLAALPAHPAPPIHLLAPPDEATGTVIA